MRRRYGRRNPRRRRAAPPCVPRRGGDQRAEWRPPVASHRLDAHEREQHHAQQHEAVPEARDLRLAVGAAGIVDGNLHRLETELRSAEDQLEVSEWIELSEIAARGFEAYVVGARNRLG